MHTHTAKQEAMETIERLPDDASLDEIVYRLFVLNKIHQGIQDIDAGRVILRFSTGKIDMTCRRNLRRIQGTLLGISRHGYKRPTRRRVDLPGKRFCVF
jgi:hypothetical protein